MKKQPTSIWAYRISRYGLAAIFLYAGLLKLFDPLSLYYIIEAYGLIPQFLIMPVAIGLPAVEVVAALALMSDIRGALLTILGLLALFIIILGYGIWMGLDVDCGCFAPDDPEGKAYHGLRPALYRDLVMVAVVGYIYYIRHRRGFKPRRLQEVVSTIRSKRSIKQGLWQG